MATKTSRLQMVIAGDNKGAVKSIEGTEKALGGLQGKLGGLGAGLAGAFSVGAVVAFGKQSVDAYSQIAGSVAQIKRLTGESAEDSSLLAFAAQQSGIDAAKAAVGWRTLAKNIDNGKVAAEGIATTDTNGRMLAFDDILGNVADHIKDLPPGYQRTAVAQRLFGKSGADMVKVLANGRDGIEGLRKEMQSYGLEFSDAGLKKYQEFVAAQRDMKAALMGIQVEVAERVVPALTKLAGAAAWFGRLNPVVKEGTVAVVGFTAATVGLSLAVGALGPAMSRGLATLHIKTAAEVEAATATGLHAAAEEAAALAAASEAAATEALAAALVAGGAAEGEFAAAATAKAAASAAAAGAAEAEAAATAGSEAAAAGATSALGPLAVALVAVYGAYKAYQEIKAGGQHIDVDVQEALKATNAELVKNAEALAQFGNTDDFVDVGRENIDVLYAMRDAADASGKKFPELDRAIKQVEKENKRAAEREAEHGTAIEDTTKKVVEQISAFEQREKGTADALSAAEGLISKQDALTNASRDSKQATYELGEAEKAARGESEEYADAKTAITDALEAVGDAEEKVTEAQGAARDAQVDLNKERVDAAQRLIDYADAAREAGNAEADAAIKVREARNELNRTNADPRSTQLDKDKAKQALIDAESDATTAKHENTQAQTENADAQRLGIEGDAEVVRAKQAVTDANKDVTDAEHDLANARTDVGKAEQAAAKVITDARAEVLVAQDKANTALLTEVGAYQDLAIAQFGTVGGLQATRDKLAELTADLDPNNPLAKRLRSLYEDIGRSLSLGAVTPYVDQYNATDGAGSPGGLDPRSHGRRKGGPVRAGQPYIVGEERPELFVPDSNGTIIPEVPAATGNTVPSGPGVVVNSTIVQNFNRGTSRQDAAAAARAAKNSMDALFREVSR